VPKEVLIRIACLIWPVLKPELKRLVEDTESPIDDWVLVVLDALFEKFCETEEG